MRARPDGMRPHRHAGDTGFEDGVFVIVRVQDGRDLRGIDVEIYGRRRVIAADRPAKSADVNRARHQSQFRRREEGFSGCWGDHPDRSAADDDRGKFRRGRQGDDERPASRGVERERPPSRGDPRANRRPALRDRVQDLRGQIRNRVTAGPADRRGICHRIQDGAIGRKQIDVGRGPIHHRAAVHRRPRRRNQARRRHRAQRRGPDIEDVQATQRGTRRSAIGDGQAIRGRDGGVNIRAIRIIPPERQRARRWEQRLAKELGTAQRGRQDAGGDRTTRLLMDVPEKRVGVGRAPPDHAVMHHDHAGPLHDRRAHKRRQGLPA